MGRLRIGLPFKGPGCHLSVRWSRGQKPSLIGSIDSERCLVAECVRWGYRRSRDYALDPHHIDA